jgi:hypothetical protein
LTSLAALATYKRQLYLGLDPANPTAAGAPGAAASRPTSAAVAAAPWQAGPAASRSFVLKSRPNGEQRVLTMVEQRFKQYGAHVQTVFLICSLTNNCHSYSSPAGINLLVCVTDALGASNTVRKLYTL